MANPLKVVLLDVDPDRGRPVFYAEPPDGDDHHHPVEGPPPRGLRPRLEAWLRKLKAGWQHSEGRAARLSRKVWHWLHRWVHPDETLLARLRSARTLEVHHPASLNAEDVAAAWADYLARSRRRHWPWFVVDLLVTPLTVLLAPLPGPNLIGYWFAYRAVHHGLILHGLGRTRGGKVETVLCPTERLDGGGHPEPADLAALGYDPEAVDEFLRRHGVRPAREPAVGPATDR